MILKILLLMECCGLGDHISALPAISMLAKEHQVTVLARSYYAELFRDVTFISAAGQDALLKAHNDKSHWLAEWSSIEENRLGYCPATRQEQFAEIVRVSLPESFSYVDYLAPRKIESEPYIVFSGNAVETFRSLPAQKEAELYGALSEKHSVIRLPRVHVSRSAASGARSSLRDFINLIYNAKAVVSVDSGPLHLACALGISAVGLFGLTGPEVYAGYNANMKPVYGKPSHCMMPCYRKHQKGFKYCEDRRIANCMETIDVAEVLSDLEAVC